MKAWTMKMVGVILVILSCSVQARPLTIQDQGYKTLKHETYSTLKADGTAQNRYVYAYEILSEKGQREFNIYRISYNANTEKIKLKAITVKNGEENIQVDLKAVEEKSLFGGHSGYDETKTLVVPLPHVKVGSQIHIEYEDELFHPPYANVISKRYHLSYGTPIQNFVFEVSYPKSATFHLQDLKGDYKKHLKTETLGEVSQSSLRIENLPGIGFVVESKGMFSEKNLVWVDVTSLPTFEETGKIASLGFDKVLNKPIPEKLTALLEIAKTDKLNSQQAFHELEKILKKTSEHFRYFGDWRSVDGGFVPRELAEITQTGYGDCKDFATLVVKVAREMGLKADVVFVYRSADPMQKLTVPSLGVFNHAIAVVKNPENEKDLWWIDATNPRSHLGLIPNDIANRDALILGQTPQVVSIPVDAWEKSTQSAQVAMNSKNLPDLNYTTQVELTGHLGWEVQNALRGASDSQIEEYLTNYLAISNHDKENFTLKEKSFQEFYPFQVKFDYALTEKAGVQRAGDLKVFPVYTFGDGHRRVLDVVKASRTSDLYMGALKEVRVKQSVEIENLKTVLGKPKSCEIKSPWLDYTRSVHAEGAPQIEDVYRVKKSRVTVDEIQSPEFSTLQDQLRDCLKNIKMVME